MSFNQDLFNRVAAVYDESPPFFATLGRVLAERADIPDDSSVVDLGAGKGAVTMAVRAAMPNGPITAVDVSPDMLTAIDRLGLEQVGTLHADLIDLALPDESFDHAVSGFTLHILAELRAAFQEIHRVLKPSGSLTWSLPGTHPDAEEWTQEYSAIYRRYQARIRDVPAEMIPAQDIDGLLCNAGFAVDTMEDVPVSIPVGDAEGYWTWTQSHGARWLSDVLPPPEADLAVGVSWAFGRLHGCLWISFLMSRWRRTAGFRRCLLGLIWTGCAGWMRRIDC